MHITTPDTITSVAWEGALVPPDVLRPGPGDQPPVVTIGQPEIWPIEELFTRKGAPAWVPPRDDADYRLLRLACTLHPPRGPGRITEARQTLTLRPVTPPADPRAVYAHSLFPDRLMVEQNREFTVSLGPELTFGDIGVKAGEIASTISYRTVFPVIQSYGAGEPAPYWVFQRHAAHPLQGSQCVYAVIAVGKRAGEIRSQVDLVVTVERASGLARFGLTREAKEQSAFRF